MTAAADFLYRSPPAFAGKRALRIGLSASYGLDEAGIREALERGMNYVFWNPTAKKLTRVLREVARTRREELILATGPTFGFFPGSLRKRVERALTLLGTDYLDVFQLYWLGKMSAFTPAVVDELVRLKEEGKVRALGCSIHDRPRAGRLAEDSPLDLLMIRYNAAHPGAEQEIFPHLARRRPAVVAYTATSWSKLLRAPKGWSGPVPSAGDCYRFCLSSPHVDVVLSAPGTAARLRENLAALERGPMAEEELAALRAFGRAVHG
ncbi:MAG TPA: aldo/keto reductase [Anaeromyxobacteraceae bacterium]|jgi:aryl-alcohol dehydrogenase-like predicted oxidoreductase|nr:aldo/keto reductase [Anaeromyxobacteraceae bacterium]